MCATKHAPRNLFRVRDRIYGLAEVTWHNTLWHDSPCLACTHHLMQKRFGNGACGVRMKRRLKSLGHPSHHGAMHHALARFHSEHVGN